MITFRDTQQIKKDIKVVRKHLLTFLYKYSTDIVREQINDHIESNEMFAKVSKGSVQLSSLDILRFDELSIEQLIELSELYVSAIDEIVAS